MSEATENRRRFEMEVCQVPQGRYLKEQDILRWLRDHAKDDATNAHVFNQLVDEVLSLRDP